MAGLTRRGFLIGTWGAVLTSAGVGQFGHSPPGTASFIQASMSTLRGPKYAAGPAESGG